MTMRPLDTRDLAYIGADLRQPECVLALASGDVYASDHRGGIARISASGSVSLIGRPPSKLRPNGFSILPGREFLVANLGDDGGAWRIRADGEALPFLMEVEGRRLPGPNFVGTDGAGRVWITISTWQTPRVNATHKDAPPDGSIVVVDERGARFAAHELAYTNEARVDPSGDWLYVNETAGRRLSRFRIGADSRLGSRQTVTEFQDGSFPDGLEFDSAGWCWIACVGSNRIIRVDPATGQQEIIFDASTPEQITMVERNYADGKRRPWTDAQGNAFGSCTSLAFGGPDMRTVFVGSLTRDVIGTFRSPIAGARPHYWSY